MFSGLIGAQGIVQAVAPAAGGVMLRIRCERASDEDTQAKDSLAINGACLTATGVDHNVVDFDVIPETLGRTTLGSLRAGDAVNVEYALRAGDRIGGHLVYGHIDATAEILALTREGQGARLRIGLPQALRPMVAEKGFIAVDGVSLTVAATEREWMEVAVIPETLRRTTLGARHAGDRVNLEADPIARYAVLAGRFE